jgi:hypothetical protein
VRDAARVFTTKCAVGIGGLHGHRGTAIPRAPEKHHLPASSITANMLDHCAACPEQFRYMSGRIYQFGDRTQVEHFWLCPRCAELLDLEEAPNGQVHVVPKGREVPDVRRAS